MNLKPEMLLQFKDEELRKDVGHIYKLISQHETRDDEARWLAYRFDGPKRTHDLPDMVLTLGEDYITESLEPYKREWQPGDRVRFENGTVVYTLICHHHIDNPKVPAFEEAWFVISVDSYGKQSPVWLDIEEMSRVKLVTEG